MNTFMQVCGAFGAVAGTLIALGGMAILGVSDDPIGGVLIAAGFAVILLGFLLYQVSRLIELREQEAMRERHEQPGSPGVLHDNDPIVPEDSPAPRPRRRSLPRPPPPPQGLR